MDAASLVTSRRPNLGPACYQEGDYWTFVYGGMLCRLRDAKGIHPLVHLLRHPGVKFAVADLLAIGDATRPSSRRREPKRSATDAEAARVLVTKHIRGVVKKIRPHHPSLAHHLDTCVRTGAQCLYSPDPSQPMRWGTE